MNRTRHVISLAALALSFIAYAATSLNGQATPTVTWVHQANTEPDRPGWSAYTSLHHDPESGRVLFYQMRHMAGNIYSTDFFAYATAANDFMHIGGTGSMSSANCNDGSASNVQPWPGDRHPVQQMAVDPSRKVLWLYNGVCSGNTRDDLWKFTLNANPALNTWTKVDISSSVPGVRSNGALVYSPDHDVLLLYGKHDITSFQETWVYCPSAVLSAVQTAAGCSAPGLWTRIHGSAETAQQPTISKSGFPQLRYHAASKKVFAFLLPLDGGTSTMEVWTYDIPTRTWANRNPSSTPSEPNACCPEQLVVYVTSGPYAEKFLYHQTAHTNTAAASKDYLYDPVTNAFTVLASVGTGPQRLAYMTWDPVAERVVASGMEGFWTASLSGTSTPPPPTCTPTISPASISPPAAGTSGSVTVTAGTGCTWTATSNAAWITVAPGASGSGSAAVAYSVAANPNTSSRTGTVTVAGNTFTVTQAGGSTPPPPPPPPPSSGGGVGRGCTSVWFIDEDCDGYGVGVRSSGAYGGLGVGDKPDADDTDATLNTQATVLAAYDANKNGVLDTSELKSFLSARKQLTSVGSVFYISPAGNNATGAANDPARPYATYHAPPSGQSAYGVWQYLKPGDVVVFRAGTYENPNMGGGAPAMRSGTPGNPVTVMSMPGENVAFQTNSNYTFDTVGANYLIIDGFTIDNPTNSGLGTGYGCAGTTGTIVRNIEAQRFNYISCIDNMHNLVLEKLVHHHQTEHGLYMGARNNPSTNITVRKSIFYKNGYLSGYGNFQYNGRVTNLIIEDNIIHSSGQWGLSLIMGVSNSIIRNNLIFNNEGHGIVMQVYPGDCIGGNDGICPYSQTGNLFTNNTFWIGRYDTEGAEPSIPSHAAGILVARNVGAVGDGLDLGNNTFQNNIFVTYNGPAFRYTSTEWLPTTTIRNNVIYRVAPPTDLIWFGPSRYSLPDFQAAFPLATGNVFANPGLKTTDVSFWGTPERFSLDLLSTSPAIGFGLATGAPSVDIRGAPRTMPPDAGAYKYGSSTGTRPPTAPTNVRIIR